MANKKKRQIRFSFSISKQLKYHFNVGCEIRCFLLKNFRNFIEKMLQSWLSSVVKAPSDINNGFHLQFSFMILERRHIRSFYISFVPTSKPMSAETLFLQESIEKQKSNQLKKSNVRVGKKRDRTPIVCQFRTRKVKIKYICRAFTGFTKKFR